MKRQVKRKLILILSIMTVLVITACAPAASPTVVSTEASSEPVATSQPGDTPALTGDPIKIGVITEITGVQAVAGKAAQESINQYVKELNASGGLLGREVQVLYADDQSTQTTAVNAFNKLVLEDKVTAILGPLYSTHCLAIKPRAEELGFPWLAMGLNDRIGMEGDPKWTFQGRTTDSYTPTLVLNFLEEKEKSNPAIIYIGDDFGIDGKDKFIPLIEERGWTVADVQAMQTGDKDYTAQILSIKASGADSIIAWLHQEEAGLFLRQLAEQGIDNQVIPVIGNSSLLGAGVTDIAGQAAEGTYIISGTAPLLQNPEWSEKFFQEYGAYPDFLAADSLDGFATIVEAIRLADATDPESVRQGFLSMKDWVGPFGFKHTFGSEDAPQQGMFSSIIVSHGSELKTAFEAEVSR